MTWHCLLRPRQKYVWFLVLKNRVDCRQVGKTFLLDFFLSFWSKNYGLYFVIPLFPNILHVSYMKNIDKIWILNRPKMLRLSTHVWPESYLQRGRKITDFWLWQPKKCSELNTSKYVKGRASKILGPLWQATGTKQIFCFRLIFIIIYPLFL